MEEKRIVKPWQAGLMLLVGTWMASGTVPVMIYYGMKVLTPGLFLPVVCILCTLMSTMAGTSWGTLATVGVACMGVAQGLGVPLPAAAGAVCTGAFFGDKVSPLSDSPVITATVCEAAADGQHSPRAHFHGACVSHFARFLLCLRPALFRPQRPLCGAVHRKCPPRSEDRWSRASR